MVSEVARKLADREIAFGLVEAALERTDLLRVEGVRKDRRIDLSHTLEGDRGFSTSGGRAKS